MAHGEVRLSVIVEVDGYHPALLAVEYDAVLGSGYGSEITRAIATQQKTLTDIITRLAPGHTEVVLCREQIGQSIFIEILSTQVKRRRELGYVRQRMHLKSPIFIEKNSAREGTDLDRFYVVKR